MRSSFSSCEGVRYIEYLIIIVPADQNTSPLGTW